jgi:hypothetical protein
MDNHNIVELLRYLNSQLRVDEDRELTVQQAALIKGISVSNMRVRIRLVPQWRQAFFVTGTSSELRTTLRRLRQAEDQLSIQT